MFCEVNGLLQSVLLAGGDGRAWAVKYWMNDRKRKNPYSPEHLCFHPRQIRHQEI